MQTQFDEVSDKLTLASKEVEDNMLLTEYKCNVKVQ